MNDQAASDVKKEAADLAAKLQPRSGKFRKISPEMDPLRLGSGWTVPDLDKPQVIIESTFGDSHPGPPASLSSSRRFARASPRPAATAPVTSAPICATARPRATTASTTRCPAAT